jgi:hypothetical protein
VLGRRSAPKSVIAEMMKEHKRQEAISSEAVFAVCGNAEPPAPCAISTTEDAVPSNSKELIGSCHHLPALVDWSVQ